MALVLVLLGSAGCIRQLATGALADALSQQGDLYAAENDPELVKEAVPFGLKTMEGVLSAQPDHQGLLLALTSGFASYGYAFVEQDAFELETTDLDEARRIERRAMRLYFRARDYGLRALAVDLDRFESRFRQDPETVLAEAKAAHIPHLYWTAAAWGLGISASGMDPEAVADLPLVEAMVRRALELDASWEQGSLYEFMVVLETVRADRDLEQAEAYYRKALELSDGKRAGTYVSYAENIAVARQDGEAFVTALNKALSVDVDAVPSERLANLIAQERARILLSRSADLFIDDPLEADEGTFSMNLSLPAVVSWKGSW